MNARFETYVSAPREGVEPKFVLVVYGDGQGKFEVTRVIKGEDRSMSFHVQSSDILLHLKREDLLDSVPAALEQVFAKGALKVSFIEGDAVVEFPIESESGFDQQQLSDLAELATKGLAPLTRDFVMPLVERESVSSARVSALQLCIGVVLAISLISLSYGGSIIPLEWSRLALYSFAAVFFLAVVFIKLTKHLLTTGKIFALCFLSASAILLMLLVGVASKEFGNQTIIEQEGIIESLVNGTKVHAVLVRLASEPHRSYLISIEYLKEQPARVPQAIKLKLRKGYFGTRYVTGLEVLN